MTLLQEAIDRIEVLVEQARNSQLREPMASSFATVDEQGRPSVRTLLLKKVDERGLVFFTNVHSRKGHHLDANPFAAVCVYYQEAHQQFQVEGPVEPITDDEADAYWQTRPRASQIGAYASHQSEVLTDRTLLQARVSKYEEQFTGMDIPRPPHWSGYRVIPERIEFWAGHPDRLNQRELYILKDGQWIKELLYP
ncbi:MAG: pyridoxamine 5'-phosphate oxidase [Gammaproteobacteria bacterium]|nr:pyridoxamine 5'-phosphate oxidase [Gammaproteobacteria bacterium]